MLQTTFNNIIINTLKLLSKDETERSAADRELAEFLQTASLIDELIVRQFKHQVRQVVNDIEIFRNKQNVLNTIQLQSVITNPDIITTELNNATSVDIRESLYKKTILYIENVIQHLIYPLLDNIQNDKQLIYNALCELEHKLQDLIFDKELQYQHLYEIMHPYYASIFRDFFANPSAKVLHIVNIVDGIGDFIHMKNWISAYEQERPGKSEVILIYSNKHQTEHGIKHKVLSLPDDQALKQLFLGNQVSICEFMESSLIIKNKLFGNSTVTKFSAFSDFNALYGISNIGPLLMAQFKSYSYAGLNCTLLNEIGPTNKVLRSIAYESQEKGVMAPRLSSQFHEYTLGVGEPNEGFCGLFFDDYGNMEQAKTIISRMSDNMQCTLFGSKHTKMFEHNKLKTLENTHLIVGYYQSGRNTLFLEEIIKAKLHDPKTEILMIVTGHDKLPSEMQILANKFTARLKILCNKFSVQDYRDLMQYLRTDQRHVFFCSGDNTLQESLAIGKQIIYLENMDPMVKSKTTYLYAAFLKILHYYFNEANNNNRQDIAELLCQLHDYLTPIVNRDSAAIKKLEFPSNQALDFFALSFAPFLRSLFDLNKNIKLIIEQPNRSSALFNLSPFITSQFAPIEKNTRQSARIS